MGNRSRPPHRRKELWVRVQARAEARRKRQHAAKACGKGTAGELREEGLGSQRTLGKGAERCGGAGRGPGRGEKTGARRRGLWVAAPHPVRPVTLTRRAAPSSAWRRSGGSRRLRRPLSSRGSCSDFDSGGVCVRLPPSPAQRADQTAAHEPARPRLATGARGGTSPKSLRQPRCARAARLSPTHTQGPGADAGTAHAPGHFPAPGHLKLLYCSRRQAAVRTRVPHQAVTLSTLRS